MLYATTRDSQNAYTAHRAMLENIAPDGGAFVPFRTPIFSMDEIAAFASGSMNQTISGVLNRLLSVKLNPWDVDFAVGRNIARLIPLERKIIISELWHNPDGQYNHICTSLFRRLFGICDDSPSEWFCIAVSVAVYFGIYCELCKQQTISAGDTMDVSVLAEDSINAIAIVYARKMGLPVGTIIFSGENISALWDLIHLGEISTSVELAKKSFTERLLHAILERQDYDNFRNQCDIGKVFRMDPESLEVFNHGLYCAVSGSDRKYSNVNSIYRSNHYITDPAVALCVGGLQDFRAKSGQSKLTLVLSCTSPLNCLKQISESTGISEEKLIAIIE